MACAYGPSDGQTRLLVALAFGGGVMVPWLQRFGYQKSKRTSKILPVNGDDASCDPLSRKDLLKDPLRESLTDPLTECVSVHLRSPK